MTLLDQLIELEFDSLKAILGDQYSWTLKSDLAEIPALPNGFLLGEAAIEVLKLRIARFQKVVDKTRSELRNG